MAQASNPRTWEEERTHSSLGLQNTQGYTVQASLNRPEGKSNTRIPAELRDRVLQSWIWGNGRQAFTSLVGRGIGFRSPQHCLWSWILLAKLTAASQLLSLYISHCFQCTNVLALLNIMVALGRQVLLFIFYRWDNQNAKLLSKLSKIISPIG